MIPLFVVSLVAGLAVGVRVMMYGVERPRAFGAETERSFRVSPVPLAAGLIVFGAVGYAASRSSLSAAAVVGLAAGVAIVASFAAVRLVKQWWTVTPEHDVDDPRYVLQGHLATVVQPIGSGRDGEIAFEVENVRRTARARGVDDSRLDEGTEVVIERIEDEVAYVEAWSQVEKRL